PHASAVNVGGVAEPDALIAEQPFAAREAGDRATDRPFGTASRNVAAARVGQSGQESRNGEGDKDSEGGAHAGLQCGCNCSPDGVQRHPGIEKSYRPRMSLTLDPGYHRRPTHAL